MDQEATDGHRGWDRQERLRTGDPVSVVDYAWKPQMTAEEQGPVDNYIRGHGGPSGIRLTQVLGE
ncbi:hypothetical protein HPP92_026294 [Vanilla planifolia]|uniref:Uncharacterized protein n=1 Tax=Vanilla planifolia TaxID=51239 RepID=A0A835U6D6_VANPL|nr:hypothetical protein HPP92_026522 [Vanilla planifolia]KAG0451269.1 hypothetical protein HPP92_026294 [Vanilla planifolia]